MLNDLQAPPGPVDLLHDPPGLVVRIILGDRIQAFLFIECVLPVIVNLVGLEQLAFVLLVTRLAAGLTPLLPPDPGPRTPEAEPPPLGGLVISLDGGFEDVDELRCIRATCNSSSSIRWARSSTIAIRRVEEPHVRLGVQLRLGVLAHQRSLHRLRRERKSVNTYDYIEAFYNRQRLHSTLNYMSPTAYEQRRQAA